MEAAKRIQMIIETAEAAADGIIAEAEAEAERYVDQVRSKSDLEAADHAHAMAALSRSLIAQAEVLSRESERLLRMIDSIDLEALPPVTAEVKTLPSLAPEPDPFSPGARLLATQMAVAGASRDEVHDRLSNEFGVADLEPLLDYVFGTGDRENAE